MSAAVWSVFFVNNAASDNPKAVVHSLVAVVLALIAATLASYVVPYEGPPAVFHAAIAVDSSVTLVPCVASLVVVSASKVV